MTRVLRFVKQITERNPSAVCLLVAVVTSSIDFATGRDIRFPLLYLLPVGLASWMGRKKLAYALSFLLPVLRISFEIAWKVPELLPIESVNAVIEILAMALYVYLIGRKATEARQIANAITTKDEEMQTFGPSPGWWARRCRAGGSPRDWRTGWRWCTGRSRNPPRRAEHVPADVESEVARFDRALESSIRELNGIREQLEQQQADVEIGLVEMRLAMLNDPSFPQKCKRRVGGSGQSRTRRAGRGPGNGNAAPRGETGIYPGTIRRRARPRSSDSAQPQNLGKRASNRLSELPPGDHSDRRRTSFVRCAADRSRQRGRHCHGEDGPASHVAILARVRHIPAVCDIKDATSLLVSGDRLLVDAETGTVTVAPTRRRRRTSQPAKCNPP